VPRGKRHARAGKGQNRAAFVFAGRTNSANIDCTHVESIMKNDQDLLSNVTCPFCGLACDDLTLTQSATGLNVERNGCNISAAAFAELGKRDTRNAVPRVAGKPATLDQAIAAAAQILSRAKAPLIAGFGTDIAGARATLELADRIGAVVDHMNMPAKLRNILTVQNSGWITTTLAEVKNRADFVLLIGSGAVTRFPRFLERAVWPKDAMFVGDKGKRTLFFLGEFEALKSDLLTKGTLLHCRHQALTRLIPALRARVNGQLIDDDRLAASDVRVLNELADAMRRASYGVIAWAAPDFDFPHAELVVQTLAELIKDLNKTQRFAGVPLGGSEGDLSSNGVQTWQTGLPLRSRHGKNGIDYDPYRYGAQALLDAGEVDALLWISSFNATRLPSATSIPRIVLGPPSMHLDAEPEVFIPVGTPGIHHGGHFVRTDKVVIMRLRKLRDNDLSSVANIMHRLRERLAA
jgi:formylmethanofuran dehydrogenase subunit B